MIINTLDGVGTIGGNSGGAICTFPFVYNGVQYSTCITDNNNGVLWCPTADLNGINWVAGTSKWGNCIGMMIAYFILFVPINKSCFFYKTLCILCYAWKIFTWMVEICYQLIVDLMCSGLHTDHNCSHPTIHNGPYNIYSYNNCSCPTIHSDPTNSYTNNCRCHHNSYNYSWSLQGYVLWWSTVLGIVLRFLSFGWLIALLYIPLYNIIKILYFVIVTFSYFYSNILRGLCMYVCMFIL